MWPVVVFDILRCNLKCVIITRDLTELLLRFVLIHLGGSSEHRRDAVLSLNWLVREEHVNLAPPVGLESNTFFCFFLEGGAMMICTI